MPGGVGGVQVIGPYPDQLTSAERQTSAERLRHWQTEAADYGIDTAFDAAQLAAA